MIIELNNLNAFVSRSNRVCDRDKAQAAFRKPESWL